MNPRYELAQILRRYGKDFVRKLNPLKQHQRVLRAIAICRTAELGGHIDRCTNCAYERISYNSCRNRHCPKCQNTNRERWVQARKADLIPCNYFHVVFTLPQELNSFCLKNPKELYNILFQSSKETLTTFANDPKHLGAQLGIIAVLHTWGQNLQLHPHIHLIVPSGGFTKEGKWKSSRSSGQFLFPIKALSMVYRAKFMEKFRSFLQQRQSFLDDQLRSNLYRKSWVVYARRPFAGPDQVIEYLGRYSHKIAISNHRLVSISEGQVAFTWKDYKHGGVRKTMTLDVFEFLRRFCLHILPPKFVKIRHYGFLANRVKQKLKIHQMKSGIIVAKYPRASYIEITRHSLGFDIEQCPCCKTGKMIRVMSFSANAPPEKINDRRNKK